MTTEDEEDQKRLMEKFKLMTKQPNISYNIYEEVDIDNLEKFYKRALFEL